MQPSGRTKVECLAEIERAGAAWEALLTEVGADRLEIPGVTGDWTVKDIVAHLNGWRARTLDRLEAAARGTSPSVILSDDTDEELEATNREIYERNRDRAASDVLAESRDQYQRLRAAVEAVSDDDLFTPGRFPWLGDDPLSAVLDGSFEHLLVDHEPEVRAWLAKQTGTGATAG